MGPAGSAGQPGQAGPPGPAGAAGTPGAQGAAGEGAHIVVDNLGNDVGAIELSSGLVLRNVVGVPLLLPVTPQGFYQTDLVFLHASTDCSGDRYLGNNGGAFVLYGQLSGSTVFYTTLADISQPLLGDQLNSYEVVKPGSDPNAPGDCTQSAMGFLSVGKAVSVVDPSLAAFATPFHLK